MSENPTLDEVQAVPGSTSDAAKTAGQLLKAARLKAGVHLAVLSVNLKRAGIWTVGATKSICSLWSRDVKPSGLPDAVLTLSFEAHFALCAAQCRQCLSCIGVAR